MSDITKIIQKVYNDEKLTMYEQAELIQMFLSSDEDDNVLYAVHKYFNLPLVKKEDEELNNWK